MKPKQELLFEYAKNKTTALEIGVHGAHSLLIMLIANPNLQIDAIDLCLWEHTEKCVQYLNHYFGNRINLLKGESLQMIKALEQSKRYDLVHIDGDHDIKYVKNEFDSLQHKFAKYATIIFDDIDAPNVLEYIINNKNLIVTEIPECKWKNCATIYKSFSN
jgi:predicted O-methyltransferase YrrM